MTKKGYVYLETVPGTRNRKIIHLTEEGRIYGEKIVMPIYQAEQKCLEKMTEQERCVYIQLFGKYINFLREEIDAL